MDPPLICYLNPLSLSLSHSLKPPFTCNIHRCNIHPLQLNTTVNYIHHKPPLIITTTSTTHHQRPITKKPTGSARKN
ncbi:hypothetical protein HanIR_Chr11g0522901 [Helianthus annuus]|nr:hypothetical protein HanIR_Chr11g0522901 [Helianthus annuus]